VCPAGVFGRKPAGGVSGAGNDVLIQREFDGMFDHHGWSR
jgi:hypothetical protein